MPGSWLDAGFWLGPGSATLGEGEAGGGVAAELGRASDVAGAAVGGAGAGEAVGTSTEFCVRVFGGS